MKTPAQAPAFGSWKTSFRRRGGLPPAATSTRLTVLIPHPTAPATCASPSPAATRSRISSRSLWLSRLPRHVFPFRTLTSSSRPQQQACCVDRRRPPTVRRPTLAAWPAQASGPTAARLATDPRLS
jgi:hypothetical protein